MWLIYTLYLGTAKDGKKLESEEAVPTGPFTILEPHVQEIGEFYGIQERRILYLQICERVCRDVAKFSRFS